jgi:hypothetical protein
MTTETGVICDSVFVPGEQEAKMQINSIKNKNAIDRGRDAIQPNCD